MRIAKYRTVSNVILSDERRLWAFRLFRLRAGGVQANLLGVIHESRAARRRNCWFPTPHSRLFSTRSRVMLTIWGDKQRYCDGISRRNFLQIGAFGAGLTLADVLRLQAAQEPGAALK